MRLMEKIRNTVPSAGEIALFYLAQAGFCIRTAAGQTIFVDPYLSDACERLFRFKRMIPAMIDAEELEADLYCCTHHHADHLDPDTVPIVARRNRPMFLGAPDCREFYQELAIPPARYAILRTGEQWRQHGISVRAVFADHGELAPEAVGFLIEVDGVKIYHTGDTAFRPREIVASLGSEVDIMIAPINGQFGNMIASEACRLAMAVRPRILVPCHFWMFVEHAGEGGTGDPATFLKEAAQLPAATRGMVMAPGECLTYAKTTS
jgi:L-ascorbate 6-phosphate lactonase